MYKTAKSLKDADNHYAFIPSWWFSYGAVYGADVHQLINWLSF
jgi:hypothetical protein